MNFPYFKTQSLLLAKRIYPEKTGDELIAEADLIFKYMISNGATNFLAHNYLSNDASGFATTLCTQDIYFTRRVPLILHDFQKKLLEDWQTGNDHIVIHARSMGMTMLIQIYALWLASFKSNVNIGIIVHSRAEKENMVAGIMSFYNTCSLQLPKIQNFTSSSITFKNYNKIIILTPSTYVVGRTLTHVLSDNTANLNFADEETFYGTIMLANVGQLVCVGTPAYDVGMFYDLAMGKILNAQLSKLPYNLHPQYDTTWASIKRKELSHEDFENQYNCQFKSVRY